MQGPPLIVTMGTVHWEYFYMDELVSARLPGPGGISLELGNKGACDKG